ncbi:MAG: traW [Gammaproteobacteria bacterium]|jgi:conjugal transfer pilus assembly protein TraW|nr:traW [Gammaproteobacteria bacterium]
MKRFLNIRVHPWAWMMVTWLTARAAFSSNLGVVGQVYFIAENDFLVVIEERIQEMQKNGGWLKIQYQIKKRIAEHADRPTSLFLPRTQTEKIGQINPSMTVPYDVKDAGGKVILPMGTTVNPLSMVSLTKELIFYDADDITQVRWVKNYDKKLKEAGIKDKLILVGGSVSSQSHLFARAIYFDQAGRLTRKFGIQHVPAIVTQSGLFLRIKEAVP